MYGVESLPRYMEGFSPPRKEINAHKRNQGDVFVTAQVRKVGWGRDQNLPKNDIKLHHSGKRLLENSSALHPVWGTMEKCKLQIARRKLALDGWRNPWGRSQSWKIAANYQMFDIPSTRLPAPVCWRLSLQLVKLSQIRFLKVFFFTQKNHKCFRRSHLTTFLNAWEKRRHEWFCIFPGPESSYCSHCFRDQRVPRGFSTTGWVFGSRPSPHPRPPISRARRLTWTY